MSKPDKPGELRDVEVEAVSIVNKAANRKRFKIFKSDKGSDEPVVEPEERVKDDASGISTEDSPDAAKTGNEEVQSSEEDTSEEAVEKGVVTDALRARSRGPDSENISEDTPVGKDADVKKSVEEVQKVGRKVSASRLAKIKEAHAMLARLIEELTDPDEEGDVVVMNKEELVQTVKESVDTALASINDRISALEKSEAAEPVEAEPAMSDIGEVIKAAIADVVSPIAVRLEKVEKARGYSNRQPDETSVQKERSDFWGDVFGA